MTSQTLIMALEGIPAFYIHALLGTSNDHEGVEKSGHNRAINRHRWDYGELNARLSDPETVQSRVMNELLRRMSVRRKQPAFHPNATQFTLQIDDRLFGLWRQSLERDQSVFALHNVSHNELTITPQSINLIDGEEWVDLLSGEHIDPTGSEITFAPYQSRWISNKV
jgi:sucrose phosphorylase